VLEKPSAIVVMSPSNQKHNILQFIQYWNIRFCRPTLVLSLCLSQESPPWNCCLSQEPCQACQIHILERPDRRIFFNVVMKTIFNKELLLCIEIKIVLNNNSHIKIVQFKFRHTYICAVIIHMSVCKEDKICAARVRPNSCL
jgi:hypothetical protein